MKKQKITPKFILEFIKFAFKLTISVLGIAFSSTGSAKEDTTKIDMSIKD